MTFSSDQKQGPAKLWGGRFTGKTDPIMERFNASINFDKILWEVDIKGSKAYASALALAGIITDEEASTLHSGLDEVAKEWADATFKINYDVDEDIHTANERRLTELVGPVGGKLHTGRSRNDQVATDVRLWLKQKIEGIISLLSTLLETASSRAANETQFLMPGYTHLQPAQPIRWSHWIMGHAWTWQRDLERLQQTLSRVNQLPLGCGALAGHPFGIDRQFLAKELGFDSVIANSLDAIGDRDFIVDFQYFASMLMVHISRWAEDLIIYSSAEFGFVTLADAYSTGSSLMPQKKNPDALELLRGKSGRVVGGMTGMLVTLKGLPTTYNKDLQEDKEALFDAVDTVEVAVQIATGVLSTLTVNGDKMLAGLCLPMLATDLADYLVRKGMSFREAHHASGAAVLMSEDTGVPLDKLSLPQLKTISNLFEADVVDVWDFEASVERRNAEGGTSRQAVMMQVEKMQSFLLQCK